VAGSILLLAILVEMPEDVDFAERLVLAPLFPELVGLSLDISKELPTTAAMSYHV